MGSTQISPSRALRAAIVALAALTLVVSACSDDTEPSAASNNGGSNNGTTNNGTTNNGATNNGATNNGATNNGATNNGATNNGFPPEVSECGGFLPRPNGDPARAVECATCVDTGCCDEAMACGDDEGCLALRQCFEGCGLGDPACETACVEMYPEASTVSSAFSTCRNTTCADACRRGVVWACLGQPETPDPVTSESIDLGIIMHDFQTGDLVPGADVMICAADDADCATPLWTGTTDADGAVTFSVDRGTTGFDGYIVATGGGRFPSITYFSTPVLEGGTFDFSVLSNTTLQVFVGLLGVTLDETRGHVAVIARDCIEGRARGVVFGTSTDDAQSTDGYIAGAIPSPAATATDDSGVGGVFNVGAGATVTASGVLEDGGTLVFERDVVVRAGFITSFVTSPNR